MKRLIYLAGAAVMLASCSGTKDYDAYEATLTEMQAQIDTHLVGHILWCIS